MYKANEIVVVVGWQVLRIIILKAVLQIATNHPCTAEIVLLDISITTEYMHAVYLR